MGHNQTLETTTPANVQGTPFPPQKLASSPKLPYGPPSTYAPPAPYQASTMKTDVHTETQPPYPHHHHLQNNNHRICATSYLHHNIQPAQHRKISRTNHNQTRIQILGLNEKISVFSRLSPEVIHQL